MRRGEVTRSEVVADKFKRLVKYCKDHPLEASQVVAVGVLSYVYLSRNDYVNSTALNVVKGSISIMSSYIYKNSLDIWGMIRERGVMQSLAVDGPVGDHIENQFRGFYELIDPNLDEETQNYYWRLREEGDDLEAHRIRGS